MGLERSAEVSTQDQVAIAPDIAATAQHSYQDLVAFFDQFERADLSAQQQKNRKSALNQFLGHLGVTLSDAIGQELGNVQFSETLFAFYQAGEQQGLVKGTLDNRNTAMRQWVKTYSRMADVSNAPTFEFFYQALVYYIDRAIRNGLFSSREQAVLLAGLNGRYVVGVKFYKAPNFSKPKLEKMAELERIVDAPVNSLTKFCKQELDKKRNNKAIKTVYGVKLAELIASPYSLNVFPDALQKEITDLIKFKTKRSVFPLNRNKSWRLKTKQEFKHSEDLWDVVSTDGKTFSATAINFVTSMKSFFGALKNIGYDPTKFSLAYLTDYSLLSEYADFMTDRRGEFTNTPIGVIQYAQSLMLRMEKNGKEKNFGFLVQHPEYSNKLLNPIPASQWESWCHDRTIDIKQYLGELKEGTNIKVGRDVEASISQYLNRQHPITILFELSENMGSYLKSNKFLSVRNRIAIERDLLMVDMFPTQPMRIKMFSIMKHDWNNQGNLYQTEDGSWAVRFKSEDFKNEKGAAADKDYNIPLEPTLWPKIENFLRNVRPLFDDPGSYVFVGANTNTMKQIKRKADGRGCALALANSFTKRTKQFLPDCAGFGPHSVRHLVATDYIKNNPSGYQVAADILHDRLSTVLKNYAHLKAKDGHKSYQDWCKTVRDDWRKVA